MLENDDINLKDSRSTGATHAGSSLMASALPQAPGMQETPQELDRNRVGRLPSPHVPR